MCYRFFVFAVASIVMAAGVAQAQIPAGYSSGNDSTVWQNSNSEPAALMAQAATATPVPDSKADAGTASPTAEQAELSPVMMNEAHPEGCDCRYCSGCNSSGSCEPGFVNVPCCGTSLSDLFFGKEQCYGGPCSPYMYSKKQFVVESWIDQGFTWNSANPGNRSNLPVTFNDRANEYEMNQLYVAMERKIDHRKLWDWGARVDLLYGSDYFFTQSVGLETTNAGARRWNGPGPRETGIPGDGGAALYGLSMPQLYAEFLTPIAYGTTIKVGHFYSIMGHESVMAPENFFYSHSYTMQYAEPFTHTGIMFDYRYRPNFSIKGGIVRGWDTWDEPSLDGESFGRIGFLGGVSWQSCDDRTALDFTIYTGDEQLGVLSGELQNRTNYSLVLKRDLSSRLTYVFQHDLGVQQGGTFTADGAGLRQIATHWYTVANYLYYKLNDRTSLGCRLEWFSDPEFNRVLQLATPLGSTGGDYYEATVGINWKPFDRCVVRPELRWDWSNTTPLGAAGAYNEFTDKNQFTLGVDALYTF